LPQPLGVIGILAPWNYPLQLTLAPAIGALAAGNRVLIKPSEFTERTSELMAELFARYFAADEAAVVLGGPQTGADFCGLAFDHLIFTGATSVGRHVMR
ncbi:aldehyde dehydrogenase family protein, partial [Acinetobacter baumannii]